MIFKRKKLIKNDLTCCEMIDIVVEYILILNCNISESKMFLNN